MAVVMGVAPNIFLRPMEPAVTRLVERVSAGQALSVKKGSGVFFPAKDDGTRLPTPLSRPSPE
jgi:hypothetical protein